VSKVNSEVGRSEAETLAHDMPYNPVFDLQQHEAEKTP